MNKIKKIKNKMNKKKRKKKKYNAYLLRTQHYQPTKNPFFYCLWTTKASSEDIGEFMFKFFETKEKILQKEKLNKQKTLAGFHLHLYKWKIVAKYR